MIEQLATTFQLPLPLDSGVIPPGKPKVWRYLLANTVVFSKEVEYGIRIQKPEREKLGLWLQRLIVSGQCETIYVENLVLGDSEKDDILRLCNAHGVELINLTLDATGQAKVVLGPW